jgi:hypothetical protein
MNPIHVKGDHAVNSKPTLTRSGAPGLSGHLFALLAVFSLLFVPASALAQAPATNTAPGAGALLEPGDQLYAGPFDGSHIPGGVAVSAPDANIWLSGFCRDSSTSTTGDKCMTGDFNGDGRADVIRFMRGNTADPGAVYVSLSEGYRFSPVVARWTTGFCGSTEVCRVGDVNGDGKDDIVAFSHDNLYANVWVALSDGTSFVKSAAPWRNGFCSSAETCDTGDFDGDGADDIVTFHGGTTLGQARVWVALSQVPKGTYNFATPGNWNPGFDFCFSGEVCMTGDFNGDSKDDIIAFARNAGALWVSLSNGTTFNASTRWNPSPAPVFCVGSELCRVGDLSGDGKADAVAFTRGLYATKGLVYAALSQSTKFENSKLWTTGFCTDNSETCDTGDFDGDGAADLIAFNPSGNVWVQLSPSPLPPSRWVMSLFIKRK